MTYAEAQHPANHFNLTGNDGIKKIQQLEAIQLGGEHDWKVNDRVKSTIGLTIKK